MAYCVHCGVKLGDSEKRCPLCATAVLDPTEPRDPSAPPVYPVRTPEQELKRSKRFLLLVSAVMLLFPALLCLMVDLLLGGGLSWSVYPSGALTLLFIAAAIPIWARRYRAYISIATDFITLGAYLYLVEQLSLSGRWFFPIVLPALALGTALIALLFILYRHHRLNKLTLLAGAFGAIALECLAIELLCALDLGGGLVFSWSPYAAAPCLFISLALFLLNGNRAVREEVRRRVHF